MILLRKKIFSRADYWGLSKSNKINLGLKRKKLSNELREIRNNNNWVANNGDKDIRNILHSNALKKIERKNKDLVNLARESDLHYGINRIKRSIGKIIKKNIA